MGSENNVLPVHETIRTDRGPVTLRRKWQGVDSYCGSAAALVALGVVQATELPGSPGLGKVMATFGPNGGRIPKGAAGGKKGLPGQRQVRRTSRDRFTVEIQVGDEEAARRREAHWLEEEEARSRKAIDETLVALLAARPSHARPAARGAHLRLVWSSESR